MPPLRREWRWRTSRWTHDDRFSIPQLSPLSRRVSARRPPEKNRLRRFSTLPRRPHPKRLGRIRKRCARGIRSMPQVRSRSILRPGISAQARRVFENLKAVLHEAGADFHNVVKATVYVIDLANFPTLNTIYAEYFGDHKPARSTVGVAALPRGAMVEIDLIAVI